uniref:Uncharacterized protein n=1 Tax=Oryza glumipatula TaxID=40148 RepID=A0A0D9YMZ5_9ORYZ
MHAKAWKYRSKGMDWKRWRTTRLIIQLRSSRSQASNVLVAAAS